MDGPKKYKKHYKSAFERLSFQNKLIMNSISDCVEEKKLNKLAEQKLLADIADMLLACQNGNVPADQIIGDDINAFCNKYCEGAPPENEREKMFYSIRRVSSIFLCISTYNLSYSLMSFKSVYLAGVHLLQITAAVLMAILCSFGLIYRGGEYMSVNIFFSKSAPSAGAVIKMIIYSAAVIAITAGYVTAFVLNLGTLVRMGLDSLRVNVLAFALISAAVYSAALLGERASSKRAFLDYVSR